MTEVVEKQPFWKTTTGWIIKIAGYISAATAIFSFIVKTADYIKDREVHRAENEIVMIIKKYYAADDQDSYNEIANLFTNQVDEYYGRSNFTQDQIVQDCKNYCSRWRFHKNIPDYASLRVRKMENGNYFAYYSHVYKTKRKETDNWKNFNLEIQLEFTPDYKIKSISERKL